MILLIRWVPQVRRWWVVYLAAEGRVSGLGKTPLEAQCMALAYPPWGGPWLRPWGDL